MELLHRVPSTWRSLLEREPNGISIGLDVAFFYDDAYFTVIIPKSVISLLSQTGTDIEITEYPVEEKRG